MLRTQGHQHHLEILKQGGSWVDLLTSKNSTSKLHLLGLTDCFPLANLKDLLATELQQNWRTLRHHNLHPSWQNIPRDPSESTHPSGLTEEVRENYERQSGSRVQANVGDHKLLKRDTESVEAATEKCKDPEACGGQSDSASSDQWFAHYVSLCLACV